jgi:hypothetical protein
LFECLPFATEQPKDGIIAYLADCKSEATATARTAINSFA